MAKTMDEVEIQGTERTLYDYAYGYCAHFGIALHEKYGAVINVIWGKLDDEWNLVHVYCTKNGKMKDASGDIDNSILIDYQEFFDYKEVKKEILSTDELILKLEKLGANREDILNDVLFLHAFLDSEYNFYDFG